MFTLAIDPKIRQLLHFSTTFQEANGLLHSDRTPKFPIEAIRASPPHRTRMGMFANGALPEDKAKELQSVTVNLEMPMLV